ncbi:MAG TPA: hypothetical protein VKA19_10605, partial [Alphaproteobacteria bacterium]|nr:hypothetical protein [Alphaproteobacteria bacterium]
WPLECCRPPMLPLAGKSSGFWGWAKFFKVMETRFSLEAAALRKIAYEVLCQFVTSQYGILEAS